MKKMLLAPAVAVAAAAATVSLTTTPAAAASTAPSTTPAPTSTPPTAPESTDPPTEGDDEDPKPSEYKTTPAAGSEITVAQLKAGIKFSAPDVLGGTPVTLKLSHDGKALGTTTLQADANGKASGAAEIDEEYQNLVDELKAGDKITLSVFYARPTEFNGQVEESVTYTIKDGASDDDTSAPATSPTSATPSKKPTATETKKPAASAKLAVSPKSISATNFVNEKKGVKITVTGAKPGEAVKFTIKASAKRVNTYTHSVVANKNGVATWSVYGTDETQVSSYIGSYKVTADVNGKNLSDSFKVTGQGSSNPGGGNPGAQNPQTGGDTGGDSWNSGSDDGSWSQGNGNLPRTGMELGALGAGAALLVIGGATVLITRRSTKK